MAIIKQSILNVIFLALTFALSATSFPTTQDAYEQLFKRKPVSETNCGVSPCVVFNKTLQGGTILGDHDFEAPGPGDQRGPCPGLNSAANHGYIPRNGVPTVQEAIDGLGDFFGMGSDLAGLLATNAVTLIGDITTKTFSIGGPLSGKAGAPPGLSYSHNKIEGDSSLTRSDAYLNGGDAFSLNLTKFTQFYSLGEELVFNGIRQINWNLTMVRAHFKYNQDDSIASNPYYFSGPFTGLVEVPGAHQFLITLASTHTEARPNGYIDQNVLRNFYAINGTTRPFGQGKVVPFTERAGNERIGPVWNTRPSSAPFTLAQHMAGIVEGYRENPSTLRLGGNLGKTNSFEAVSVSDLTNGTYTEQSLLQGNNLGCFALSALLKDAIQDGKGPSTPEYKLLNKYIAPYLVNFDCPTLKGYNQRLFNKFPGYKYNPKAPAKRFL